jgi:hypothetical protein
MPSSKQTHKKLRIFNRESEADQNDWCEIPIRLRHTLIRQGYLQYMKSTNVCGSDGTQMSKELRKEYGTHVVVHKYANPKPEGDVSCRKRNSGLSHLLHSLISHA